MPKDSEHAATIGAAAIIGALVVGVLGITAAIAASWAQQWVGTGVCLCASGLSFGFAANAVWRH
jgi:hypothetical protein